MTCSRGRANIKAFTKLRLFADSGGFCQNPACLEPLFKDIEDNSIHIAEMAHIFSAVENGPRSNKSLTAEQRALYENLILLCPTCHTVIDKAEAEHPDELISEWKTNHKRRIEKALGLAKFATRKEARAAIQSIQRENCLIHERYGPESDERYNPESSMPRQWLRKIRVKIIPNNRSILSICELNANLLSEKEADTVSIFQQHVDDFEAKHIGGSDLNGIQFPIEMNNVFEDIDDG